LMLAGSGAVLSASEAEGVGLVDLVVSRSTFEQTWRSLARSLAVAPATEIKRVMAGVSPPDAVAAFAKLWIADEHWRAADRVMKRSK
jgi:enoyl-CoA hydratase